MVPSGKHSFKFIKPGKQSLNLPPAFVSSQWPAILGRWFFAIVFMRRNQLNAHALECLTMGGSLS
jgi:hypothetical protein